MSLPPSLKEVFGFPHFPPSGKKDLSMDMAVESSRQVNVYHVAHLLVLLHILVPARLRKEAKALTSSTLPQR